VCVWWVRGWRVRMHVGSSTGCSTARVPARRQAWHRPSRCPQTHAPATHTHTLHMRTRTWPTGGCTPASPPPACWSPAPPSSAPARQRTRGSRPRRTRRRHTRHRRRRRRRRRHRPTLLHCCPRQRHALSLLPPLCRPPRPRTRCGCGPAHCARPHRPRCCGCRGGGGGGGSGGGGGGGWACHGGRWARARAPPPACRPSWTGSGGARSHPLKARGDMVVVVGGGDPGVFASGACRRQLSPALASMARTVARAAMHAPRRAPA
jgi:hypothetical protein